MRLVRAGAARGGLAGLLVQCDDRVGFRRHRDREYVLSGLNLVEEVLVPNTLEGEGRFGGLRGLDFARNQDCPSVIFKAADGQLGEVY